MIRWAIKLWQKAKLFVLNKRTTRFTLDLDNRIIQAHLQALVDSEHDETKFPRDSILYSLGVFLEEKGLADEAVWCFSQLPINWHGRHYLEPHLKNIAEIHFKKAEAYREELDLEQAVFYYKQIPSLSPYYKDANFQLGNIYRFSFEQPQQALRYFQRATSTVGDKDAQKLARMVNIKLNDRYRYQYYQKLGIQPDQKSYPNDNVLLMTNNRSNANEKAMTRKASNDNATPRTPKTMHERGPFVEVDFSVFDQIKIDAIRNGNYPTTTTSEPPDHLKNFCKKETPTFATGYSEFFYAVKKLSQVYYEQLAKDKPIFFSQIWQNRINEIELIKNELEKNAQHGYSDMSLYWLCTAIANQELDTFFGRRYLPEELKKIIYQVSCNELHMNSLGTYNYEQLNKNLTEAQVELTKEKTARLQADNVIETRNLQISKLQNNLIEITQQKMDYFNMSEDLIKENKKKDKIIKTLKINIKTMQAEIDSLQTRNEALQNKVDDLEAKLAAIGSLETRLATLEKLSPNNTTPQASSNNNPDWSKIHQTGSPIHSASQNHQSGFEPGPTHEKYVFQANSHI